MSEMEYHIPVLLTDSLNGLLTDADGIYIDATMGGGGHTKAILEKLSADGRLIAVDQDPDAIAEVKTRIDDSRLTIIHGNFGFLDSLIDPLLHGNISGILLDLGVSSHQIDKPERGFSFQHEGPLDMRMGNLTGLSAYTVVNEYDLSDLKHIFYKYGEERYSAPIAKAIIERRPLTTTAELTKAVASVIQSRFLNKSLARIFQAIRIEVNQELTMLESALKASVKLLKPKGRIVAISYHSLEDRLVKHYFRSGSENGIIKKDLYGNPLSPLTPVMRKPIVAADSEIAFNSRARSARLRVAERTQLEANS